MVKTGPPYHVVPDKQNGSYMWKVKREGSSRATSTHRKKTAAVRKAKTLARRHNVGIHIHRRDGTQAKQSYTAAELC